MTLNPNAGWTAAPLTCEACGHGWVAVVPASAGLGSLECPKCGVQRSRVSENADA